MTRRNVIWHGNRNVRYEIGEIGKTPLVEIRQGGQASVYAKAEFHNPTGSHKDRGYLHMIEDLERCGRLNSGMTLVDFTSGNGGASLAFIANAKGYRAIVTMPANMTSERVGQIRSYGAELTLTDPTQFIAGARAEAERIVKSLGPENAVLLNQSENPAMVKAYTAIPYELPESVLSCRKLFFIAGIGTGASISGIAKALRELRQDKETHVIGFEAAESATSYVELHQLPLIYTPQPHTLIGVSPGKVAKNTDLSLIDDVTPVGALVKNIGLSVARELGLAVGRTSRVALALALDFASALEPVDAVFTVLYDGSWKYESIDGNILRR
jgi:cysteine synthase A